MSDSPVGPEDIRAAAEVYRELGPDYQSAVLASFLHRVDQEVEARVQARLAALGQVAAQPPARAPRPRRRRGRRVRDLVAVAAGAVAVLAGVAVAGHHSAAAPRISVAHGKTLELIPGPLVRVELRGPGTIEIRGPKTQVRVRLPHPPQPPAAP